MEFTQSGQPMKTTPDSSSGKSSAVGQKAAQAAPVNYWNIAPEQLLTMLHATTTGTPAGRS